MPRTLRILRAALVLLVPSHASAQFDNDQHVAFDNTVTRGSYHYSAGSVLPPRDLELADGRCHVHRGA